MKNIKFSLGIALIIIVGSILISWLIANVSVNYNNMELGALINFLGPFLIGIASLIVFLIIDWIAPKVRIWSTIIIALINITIGIQIRMDSACC